MNCKLTVFVVCYFFKKSALCSLPPVQSVVPLLNYKEFIYSQVGQNVFIGSTSDERSYESVMEEIDGGVDSWYNEVKDPGFNSGNIDPFV